MFSLFDISHFCSCLLPCASILLTCRDIKFEINTFSGWRCTVSQFEHLFCFPCSIVHKNLLVFIMFKFQEYHNFSGICVVLGDQARALWTKIQIFKVIIYSNGSQWSVFNPEAMLSHFRVSVRILATAFFMFVLFFNHLISAQLKTPPQYLVKLNIYIVQENIIPFLKSKICCFCQFLWSGISFILCYPPNHFIAKSTDPLMAFQETDSTNNNHVKYTMFTNC